MTINRTFQAAAVTALLLASCVATAADTIRIGGALSMTGAQAAFDIPAYQGAQVAVQYLNDNGGLLGKPVEFINIDGKSDAVTVGNVTIELIDRGAQVIIAPCDFDFGSPASREAQAAGLVGISTCASDPLYSSWTLGDKQFTQVMWNTTIGAAAADFAVKEKGWKSAYVVTDQFIAYTQSLSRYFIEQFEHNGGNILLEDTYTNGDNHFSAQLARLRALKEKPDVIFVSSYGTDNAMIIRALREAGFDMPVLGGDVLDDPAIHAALGERFGNQLYFVAHTWMGPEAHPDMMKFIGLYQDMFGQAPDTSYVSTGWDTIMLLAEGIKAAGSTGGDALARALEQGTFHLLSGELNYSSAAEGHVPNKSAALIEVHRGKPAFIGWRKPEHLPNP